MSRGLRDCAGHVGHVEVQGSLTFGFFSCLPQRQTVTHAVPSVENALPRSLPVKCILQEPVLRDFPGGPVVQNPSFNSGEVGSIPGRGTKIPHAAGQLSPRHNKDPAQPKKKKKKKIRFCEETTSLSCFANHKSLPSLDSQPIHLSQ